MLGFARVTPAEARHEIHVTREYMAWSDGLRVFAQWNDDQECRARVFGKVGFTSVLKSPSKRRKVRKAVAEDEDELRVDHTVAELGGGA